MNERFWSRVGAIGALLAGIGGLVAVLIWWNTPASRLTAEIRPVIFKLPFTTSDIIKEYSPPRGEIGLPDFITRKFDKPLTPNSSVSERIKRISNATGLVEINLTNNGDLPITGVRVNVT